MSLMIPGRAVQLEALIREPKEILRGGAVLCHPHPVYGGTMDNRVVYRAAKAAIDAGFVALRFNFRGVGGSTGQFDHGLGEKDDVASAIDWLAHQYPGLPLALIGYSFGAWIGLQVGFSDSRIQALAGLGLPLDMYDFDFLIENPKPALYIVGTRDEFCAQERLQRLERRLPPTSDVRSIENADHFFSDQIEAIQSLIFDFFEKLHFDQDTA